MKKVYFIINALAGKNRLRGYFLDIAHRFCEADMMPIVCVTLYEKHAKKLAEEAAMQDAELIVCCGGDGTLNEVVSGVLAAGKQVDIGYIPSGSTNDFAQSMQIPFSVPEAVERIINGDRARLDVGQFNGRCFNYVASFGAFTAVSYNTPREIKNMFGQLAYFFESVKDIGSIVPHHVKLITAQGEEVEGDFSFGAVCNSRSIGGVVHIPDEMVSMNDGKFEILLIKMPKSATQLGQILHGLSQSDYSGDMFCFLQTEELRIETKEVLNWSLDGELEIGQRTTTIKNLHNAVTFRV